MSFLIYDLSFLVLFAAFVFYFLYSRKQNIKREGLLLLYKASWGIKLIDRVGKKAPKFFHVLSYISIGIGYILMVLMIWLLGRIVYLYTIPSFVQTVKIPPLLPLFPYVDKLAPSLGLPTLHFVYFIIVIAIIAIPHEFFHGIFAAHNKIKIKSTGFGFFPFFLPVFLAAFVEQDEKTMEKKSIFGQLAVLSAGTFANLITAIVFFGILLAFFSLAFTPSGIVFNDYPLAVVDTPTISMVNGISLLGDTTYEKILELSNEEGFNEITINGEKYIAEKSFLEQQKSNENNLVLYYDSPAVKAKLENTIFKINEVEIRSIDALKIELAKHSPGESITLNVLGTDGEDYDKDIVLGSNPESPDKAWLGIGFTNQISSGALGKIISVFNFKDPHVYYKPALPVSQFFYDLLWWIVVISISVALVNMLPLGMFDGGRFFYLTILVITGKERVAKRAYAFSTYFLLAVFLVLMLLWGFLFF